MKNIKCPICGAAYTLSTYGFPEKIEAYRFECEECDYGFDRRESYEEAVSVAKKFISEFPPIMRLNQGDNVLVWLSDDIHTVLGVNLEAGKIHLQDVYGDANSYNPTGIKKWPWELEQKGGAEQ